MVEAWNKIAGKLRAEVAHWRYDIWEFLIAVFSFRVDVLTMRGRMPGSEDVVTLLYVGRRKNLSNLTKKFFLEAETVSSLKSNLLSFPKALKVAESGADVVFVDVGWPHNDRLHKKGGYLELPVHICMTTYFEETWEATVKNFRKTIRKNIGRLIRKNNYRCVQTSDPTDAKDFYDTFYLAFIQSRHQDETRLTPRAVIEDRAQKGTILQVVDDDGIVAAGVYFPADDCLRLLVTGMPEAYLEKPPVAAMQALYYFSLQYAFENGYKSLNFLGTRPLPTDGLYQFKRKWGAVAEDNYDMDSILFKPANTQAAVKFCELFPIGARKDDTLQLVVSATVEDFGAAEAEKMLAEYHCRGFDDVKVVHLCDQSEGGSETLLCDETKVRVKRCNLESFAKNYMRD